MESLRVCKVLFLVTFPFHSKSKGKEAGLCQGLPLACMDLLWAVGWTAPPGVPQCSRSGSESSLGESGKDGCNEGRQVGRMTSGGWSRAQDEHGLWGCWRSRQGPDMAPASWPQPWGWSPHKASSKLALTEHLSKHWPMDWYEPTPQNEYLVCFVLSFNSRLAHSGVWHLVVLNKCLLVGWIDETWWMTILNPNKWALKHSSGRLETTIFSSSSCPPPLPPPPSSSNINLENMPSF